MFIPAQHLCESWKGRSTAPFMCINGSAHVASCMAALSNLMRSVTPLLKVPGTAVWLLLPSISSYSSSRSRLPKYGIANVRLSSDDERALKFVNLSLSTLKLIHSFVWSPRHYFSSEEVALGRLGSPNPKLKDITTDSSGDLEVVGVETLKLTSSHLG